MGRLKELYEPLTERLFAKKVAVEMFQRDALSFSELEAIQTCSNPSEAASKLLSLLLLLPEDAVSAFSCFLEALKVTNQEHIFLWISYTGIEHCITSRHLVVRYACTFTLNLVNY